MPPRGKSMSFKGDRKIGTPQVAEPLHHAVGSKYDRLIARAKSVPAATTIVVHPCDESSLRGAPDAAKAGIIVPTLVGPAAKIGAVARANHLPTADRGSS